MIITWSEETLKHILGRDSIGLHGISELKSIGQVSNCLKRGALKLSRQGILKESRWSWNKRSSNYLVLEADYV